MFKLLALVLASASLMSAGPFVVGDVFASTGNGKVRVYSQAGVFKMELDTTGGGFTTGSTFDKSGNFYATDFTGNKVAKFDSNGALVNAAVERFWVRKRIHRLRSSG